MKKVSVSLVLKGKPCFADWCLSPLLVSFLKLLTWWNVQLWILKIFQIRKGSRKKEEKKDRRHWNKK